MRRLIVGLAVVVACVSTYSVAQAGLIVNGSFEQPPIAGGYQYQYIPGDSTIIPGWHTLYTGVERFDPAIYGAGASQDGHLNLDLNTDFGVGGGIQQTIPMDVGQPYILSFYVGTWFWDDRDGTARVTVSAADYTAVFSVVNMSSTIAWTPFSASFTATSAETTISFSNYDSPRENYSLIDNVSVAAIPEPSSLVTMSGLLLVGLLSYGLRRRKRTRA